MWELDYKKIWALKNWCFWCWRRLLRVPWTARRFGRTDAEAETPILWPPHAKSWLVGKDPDAGRKRMTEDELAGWHHWLDGRESEWTPGDGEGQGSLACCDSRGRKESDTTEQLNWNEGGINWMVWGVPGWLGKFDRFRVRSHGGRNKLTAAWCWRASEEWLSEICFWVR